MNDQLLINIPNFELTYEIDDKSEQISEQFFIQNQPNKEIKQFYWEKSFQCYFKYLIMKSYTRQKIDRVFKTSKIVTNTKDNEIKDNEYISIKSINKTASSSIDLIYHVKLEELFVLKKYDINLNNKKEELGQLSLLEREKENYIKFSHPFIPDFIGTIQSQNAIIIKYIKGETLLDIKSLNLNKKEKMKIIFELLITIQFLLFESQIYRDLKPNNIIIDENKNIVLIDFDRLVECQKDNICDGESVDIGSKYMAPEIMEKQNYSFSADIYSIAQIIYYILCEEEPTSALNINNLNLQSFLDFYKKCTNIDPMQRPTISQVINNFLFGFGPLYENNVKFDKNLIEMYENNLLILDDENIIPIDLITLEEIYRNEMYIKKDFMKIVYYVNLFMYKNRSIALDSQAFVYENSDFGKALEKYTESANLNNPDAQFYLGQLYYIGDKVECDFEKGIYYLQLSANGNNGKASFLLGLIYLNDEKVKKDINKATFYLKKAADLNEPDAQYVYGDLFFKGENVPFDFNKAIEYFTRATNNNSIDALLSLG